MRTAGLHASADAALLRALACVAASLVPPSGFALPKQAVTPGSGSGSGSRRRAVPGKRPKQAPPISLVTAVVAFEDLAVSYAAEVAVPEAFRKRGGGAKTGSTLRFGLARLAAAIRPEQRRADAEVAGVTLTYEEQYSSSSSGGGIVGAAGTAAGTKPLTVPLLVIQEVLATAQLLKPDQATPPAPPLPRAGSSGELPGQAAAKEQQQPQKDARSSSRGTAETGSYQALEIGVELDGLRATFDAEAVFAACQIAADVQAVRQAISASAGPAASSEAGGLEPLAEQPASTEEAAAPSPRKAARMVSAGSSGAAGRKPARKASAQQQAKQALVDVRLKARASDLAGEFALSEQVCWGVRVGAVSYTLAPRCAVVERCALALNQAPLLRLGAAVATLQLPGKLEAAPPEQCPWALFAAAAAADGSGSSCTGDLGRMLTGGSCLAAAPDASAADIDSAAEAEDAQPTDAGAGEEDACAQAGGDISRTESLVATTEAAAGYANGGEGALSRQVRAQCPPAMPGMLVCCPTGLCLRHNCSDHMDCRGLAMSRALWPSSTKEGSALHVEPLYPKHVCCTMHRSWHTSGPGWAEGYACMS